MTKDIRAAKGLRNRDVNFLEKESCKEMSDNIKTLFIGDLMCRI